MKLIQDLGGTTYHVAKITARSNLRRKLITATAANVIEKLEPKQGKRAQQTPS
jgi:hypothetical protein